MISYIKGELAAFEKDKVVVEVNGMGLGVYMPLSSMNELPQTGNDVKLHTYMNVREDAMQLFGFLTKDELEIFKLLIGVSGIGPKGGLAVLSTLSADDLRYAILSGDAKAISAAPGIGKKTAEKVIIELKDKLNLDDLLEPKGSEETVHNVGDANGAVQSEAIQALVALGYGSTESLKAVKQVNIENGTTEEILKAALKYLL